MTPERWQQIRDLLEQALSLAPEQRAALLDCACASDSELRKEVETLLVSSDKVRSSFLQSAPPPHVLLSPGTRLGEYEIKSMLGTGGMGEVYRARDTRLGRDVAIKVLPALFSTDAGRLRRFEQEARAAAALNHPNILAVHQMGKRDGSPYLVSELLAGETLREQLKRGRIPVRKAIDYGVQIARGLSAAHAKGIVHRDLKPENLFVSKDGGVKILDFGLAKLTQPASEHSSPTLDNDTERGTVMGTVGYMSPEQVRGHPADHRTDIFSFGAVLYEMLAGKRAFQKPTAADTLSAILNEDPPAISEVTPSVSPALERVLHRCLEKSPEQRFQSASDLAFALDALSEASGRADSSASSVAPRPLSLTNQTRRLAIWGGLGTLVLIVVGWALRRSLMSQPEPFRRVEITQVTFSGKVQAATLSPDGKYVAYARVETGNPGSPEMQSLWVKQITGGDVQVLPPAAVNYRVKGSGGLTFSPDGDFLYLVRTEASDPNVGILYKMPTLGGMLRRITSHVDSAVSLSPDGQQMAFVRNTEENNSVLVAAKEDGSEERQVAVHKDLERFVNVAWSPKSATIVATTDASETSYSQLIETRVQGGSERSVGKERWSVVRGLAWAAHGRGLVVNAQQKPGGPTAITYVSYDTGEVRKITNGANDIYWDLSASTDSHSLVSVLMHLSGDVWVGLFNDPNSFQPITTNHLSSWGTWTPDGRIVYQMVNQVWLCNADGTNVSQLTPSGERAFGHFRVSPDGRYIVFNSWQTTVPHLWRMDAGGGNLVQLTNSNYDSAFGYPDYSPDGRWVLYAKWGRERGIWKVPIEGGDPVRVKDADAVNPAVSPDGKMIAYEDVGGDHPLRVALMPYGGGPTIRTFEIPGILMLRWMPDGREILYITKETPSNIWSQPIAGGKPKQVTHFISERIDHFDLSRDGSRIVVSRSSHVRDAMLIRDAPQ